MMKILIIVAAVSILVGGCTAAGEKTSVGSKPMAGHNDQLVASPSVTVAVTTAAPQTKTESQPTLTLVPTSSPTMAEVSTATASPTPVEIASPTATPTITPTPAPRVLANVRALNLRKGPGENYPAITSLAGGLQLAVKGRNESGDWLLVEHSGRSGWVSARYVGDVPKDLPTMPVPPTAVPTVPPPTATPEITLEPTAPPAPIKQSTIVLGPDTTWPVSAERIIGWGYEFVDASKQWDLVFQRDVYGVVAHDFWGEQLYGPHPQGIRITLIDPVWDGQSPTPLAPVPLFAGDPGLFEGFGDGLGSMIYVGCAIDLHHHYDPQECFIAIDAGGEHLSDIVVAATITAQHANIAGYFARTPDFSRPPFHLLGEAYREGDQWRWRNPFLEVVPTS